MSNLKILLNIKRYTNCYREEHIRKMLLYFNTLESINKLTLHYAPKVISYKCLTPVDKSYF